MTTDSETLELSCFTGGPDAELFSGVVNQGIDARLEAFTKSKFWVKGTRLYLSIDPSEVQILVRRLEELEIEDASLWASDIIESFYGLELRS